MDFVGRPFDDSSSKKSRQPINGSTVGMTNYFAKPGDKAEYIYDFGDRWEHNVVLEHILPAVKDKSYPVCLNGKRACPPEDCGGSDGYNELLKIIKNPKHPDHGMKWNWLIEAHNCPHFDSELFIPIDVHFRPAAQRRFTFKNKAEEAFYDCIQM